MPSVPMGDLCILLQYGFAIGAVFHVQVAKEFILQVENLNSPITRVHFGNPECSPADAGIVSVWNGRLGETSAIEIRFEIDVFQIAAGLEEGLTKTPRNPIESLILSNHRRGGVQ
jgi:hypothetical protein